MHLPFFSIITVVYNGERTIQKTLEAVLNQNYSNFEYLIIDGASKDNTISIVEKYIQKFNGRLRILSEKDKGIYDAMNKGIGLSKGEIIHILNADDIYCNENILLNVSKEFDQNCELLCGPILIQKPERNICLKYDLKNLDSISHPGLFVRKAYYDKNGLFNIKYKFAADIDFFLRIPSKSSIKAISQPLVIMQAGGAGTSLECLFEGLSIYWKHRKYSRFLIVLIIDTPRRMLEILRSKRGNILHTLK